MRTDFIPSKNSLAHLYPCNSYFYANPHAFLTTYHIPAFPSFCFPSLLSYDRSLIPPNPEHPISFSASVPVWVHFS